MKAIEQRRRQAGQQGFTLVELLIVIAILGILAAVVVFAVGQVTQNAEDAACDIEDRTLKTAVQAYRAQTGNWPTAAADLVTGGWLEEAPAATKWTFVAGPPASFTGIGICAP